MSILQCYHGFHEHGKRCFWNPVICFHKARQIGHSHRHDNMTISLLSIGEAVLISASSLPFGSCSKLLGSSAPATKLRSLKQFGCRHCEQSLPGLSTGTTSLDTEVPSTGGNGPRQESGPTKKLFTFNGLRSHAKTK